MKIYIINVIEQKFLTLLPGTFNKRSGSRINLFKKTPLNQGFVSLYSTPSIKKYSFFHLPVHLSVTLVWATHERSFDNIQYGTQQLPTVRSPDLYTARRTYATRQSVYKYNTHTYTTNVHTHACIYACWYVLYGLTLKQIRIFGYFCLIFSWRHCATFAGISIATVDDLHSYEIDNDFIYVTIIFIILKT